MNFTATDITVWCFYVRRMKIQTKRLQLSTEDIEACISTGRAQISLVVCAQCMFFVVGWKTIFMRLRGDYTIYKLKPELGTFHMYYLLYLFFVCVRSVRAQPYIVNSLYNRRHNIEIIIICTSTICMDCMVYVVVRLCLDAVRVCTPPKWNNLYLRTTCFL